MAAGRRDGPVPGIDGGGYDLIIRDRGRLNVRWVVLLASVVGLIPIRSLTVPGWIGLAIFTAFVVLDRDGLDLVTQLGSAAFEGLTQLTLISVCSCSRWLFIASETAPFATRWERSQTVVVIVACVALLSQLRPGTFSGLNRVRCCRECRAGWAGRWT